MRRWQPLRCVSVPLEPRSFVEPSGGSHVAHDAFLCSAASSGNWCDRRSAIDDGPGRRRLGRRAALDQPEWNLGCLGWQLDDRHHLHRACARGTLPRQTSQDTAAHGAAVVHCPDRLRAGSREPSSAPRGPYTWSALGAGVVGAVLGTLGGYQARARLAASFGRDLPIALLEDAVAVCGGFAIAAVTAAL